MTRPLDRGKVTEHLADADAEIEGLTYAHQALSQVADETYRRLRTRRGQREELARLGEVHGLTADPVEELRSAAAAVLAEADGAMQVRLGDPDVGELRPVVGWPVLEALRTALG